MGFLDKIFPKAETRAVYNTPDSNTTTVVDQPFSLDSLLNTDAITEDKVLKIPTARACVDLITSTIGSMPVYLYKEAKDGSIERVDDKRVNLLNHESNQFLNGYSLKKNMAKDYLLHGASYVSIVEAANTILELHPLQARSVTIQKSIQNGYKVVNADIVLSASESSAYGNSARKLTKFKPYELMISVQDSYDGLTGKGIIAHGQDVFRQALSEMDYTNSLYERGALPLGLLKTESRLNESQANGLREAWKNLYGGMRNAAKTVVLQEGMTYQALSMNPNEIQMIDTKRNTASEICKLFNVPESMISTAANKYGSIEQNQLHFLKHTLGPILFSLESSMDRALLLEKEKKKGYFFRFDTSELVRSTEKERVDSVVAAVQGGIFTINEARAKFDLPAVEEDALLVTPGAEQKGTEGEEAKPEDNKEGDAQPNEKPTGTKES